MTKAIIIDRSREMPAPLREALDGVLSDVWSVTNLEAVTKEIDRRKPDVVVIGGQFSAGHNTDMLTRIRRHSDIPVIVASSDEDELEEILALRGGADDFIRFSSSPRVFAERIRSILSRNMRVQCGGGDGKGENDAIVRGPLTLDRSRHLVTWSGAEVAVSKTEFILLEGLARNPGHVKSRDQLMDIAYGDGIYVCDRTVDSHIKRLRKKLRAVDPDFDAIQTVYGVGYRFNLSDTHQKAPAMGYVPFAQSAPKWSHKTVHAAA